MRAMPIPFRANIAAMAGYVPGEQPPAGTRLIKLNTNENPYPPSPAVAEAIRAELAAPDTVPDTMPDTMPDTVPDGAAEGAAGARHADGRRLRLYSDPAADLLCQAAADVLGFPRAGILAGNGSDELLSVLARAFLSPGDKVAFPYPTYVLYETMARIQDAAIDTVDFPSDFTLPSGLFGRAARLTYLANPNSPSGTMIPLPELTRLAESLSDGVLVIDEAYAGFAGDSALALARTHANVVVLRTLSKSHSLAGMRVGLLFGSPEMIAGLSKVRDSYSLDRLAIVAGAAAIRDQAWVVANCARITATRERLVGALEGLGLAPLPSRANFVFVRMGSAERARKAQTFLRQQGLLVRYFDLRLVSDGIRITVGTDAEIDALLGALSEFVTQA